MIEVVCICGGRIQAQDEHAGLSMKCPKCRKLVHVVAPPPGAAAPTSLPAAPDEPPPAERAATANPPDLAARDHERLHAALERLITTSGTIRTLLGWILLVLVLHLLLVAIRLAAGIAR